MNPQYSEQPDGVQTVFAEPEENDAQSVFDTDEEDGVPDLYLLPMHEGNTDETEDSTNRRVRTITFLEPNQPAVHTRWSIPRAMHVRPDAYPLPLNCSSWAEMLVYSVPYKRYEPVEAEFNIIGWGRIILCRKAGLLRAECPEIGRWERWCRWSSDMYDEAYEDGTYVHPYLIHDSDSETDGSESCFESDV